MTEVAVAERLRAPSAQGMKIFQERIDTIAAILSQSGPAVPLAFQGKMELCRAVVMQADEWEMSPLAVIKKAYVVNGQLAYEGQLVHALINLRAPLDGRLEFSFEGEGATRRVVVTGKFREFDQPSVYRSPPFSQIKTKNSPIWHSDTDQQFRYFGVRNWARAFCPEVLLGIYTPEEAQMRNVTPAALQARNLLDDDAIEADFADHIMPTEADSAAFGRWEKKASGEGDSRDPRDAPENGPAPPPQGAVEPDDLADVRAWAGGEQGRLLALMDAAAVTAGSEAMVADKRWGRLKAYDQPVARAVHASVAAHVRKLKAGDDFPGDR